jgi:hypothetical protein
MRQPCCPPFSVSTWPVRWKPSVVVSSDLPWAMRCMG